MKPIDSPRLADDPLVQRISAVGTELSHRLSKVLAALPGAPDRPSHLAEVLGVNRDVAGRVLIAARCDDPITATHVIPGPAPLRRMLEAAADHGVSGTLIDEAKLAVRQFERLIRDEFGDRDAFDALLGQLLPEVRARHEQAGKLAMFRGASRLKGVHADLWLHTVLVRPSDNDSPALDVVHVYGPLGLRCVRPLGGLKFSYHEWHTDVQSHWQTLGGLPADEADGTDLDIFCKAPPAQLALTKTEAGTVYALTNLQVGVQHPVDKLLAEVRPGAMSRWAAARPRNLKAFSVAPAVPAKELVFDVLLHENALPGAEPRLLFHDTTIDGMASVNDPSRDMDRIDLAETVTYLGRGSKNLSIPSMPNYVKMIRHVCAELQWSLQEFRGYRCRVQYPMYGAQAAMAFNAPPKPR